MTPGKKYTFFVENVCPHVRFWAGSHQSMSLAIFWMPGRFSWRRIIKAVSKLTPRKPNDGLFEVLYIFSVVFPYKSLFLHQSCLLHLPTTLFVDPKFTGNVWQNSVNNLPLPAFFLFWSHLPQPGTPLPPEGQRWFVVRGLASLRNFIQQTPGKMWNHHDPRPNIDLGRGAEPTFRVIGARRSVWQYLEIAWRLWWHFVHTSFVRRCLWKKYTNKKADWYMNLSETHSKTIAMVKIS